MIQMIQIIEIIEMIQMFEIIDWLAFNLVARGVEVLRRRAERLLPQQQPLTLVFE